MRPPVTEAGALIAGTGVSGVLTYLLLALGTRIYGADGFAPASVLWSFWSLAAAALTLPIQHWMIRQVVLDGHSGGVRAALPRLAGAVLAIAAALAAATLLLRNDLFRDDRLAWPVLVGVMTLTAASSGLIRGVLASRQRFYSLGAAVAGESLLRLAGGILAALIAADVTWFAAALTLGPLVGFAFPGIFRFTHHAKSGRPDFGFLGGSASGFLGAQILLNSGAVVLALLGGAPAEVTSLFVCLAIMRTPYLLALGLTARFTGPLTRLHAQGRRRRMRTLLRSVLSGTAALVAIGSVGGYSAGPGLLRLIFGAGVVLDPRAVAGVIAGSTLALGGLALTQLLIAGSQARTIAAAWLAALVTGLALVLTLPFSPVFRVVTAFLASEVVAFSWMLIAGFSRSVGRQGPGIA